jgi:serine/threonine protein kinase
MIKPGDIINNCYYVLEELGDGNFGKTFEVEDRLDNDHKVIKILKFSDFRNPRILELFIQEFDVLRKVNHPGIPKIKASGYFKFVCPHTNDTLHSLVMEKIEGQDLGKWVENNKITNTKQAMEWLKQLIDILAHVHSQNYIHRDIKPDNIMLKPDGQLVLIDFGIVKEFIQKSQKRTIPTTRIGTPGYSSPEQEGQLEIHEQINYTSDFFSLGRTFVHLLTGTYPGYDNFQIDRPTRKLLWRDQAPGISEKFKDLIDLLIEYEPQNRPQNTQKILQQIEAIERNDGKNPGSIFPPFIVFLSFSLNFILLTLLATGVALDLGWKVFFVVVILVIGGFLVLPLIKYIF